MAADEQLAYEEKGQKDWRRGGAAEQQDEVFSLRQRGLVALNRAGAGSITSASRMRLPHHAVRSAGISSSY